MDERRMLILRTDGAARGNPGPAAAGVVIERADGTTVAEGKRALGELTNNQAEYRALILGLRAVARYAPAAVRVCLDSELVVKQMTGQYRVKHPEIVPLYQEAVEAASQLPEVTFRHVERARNAEADRLANLAIEGRMIRGRGALSD